MRLSHRTYYEEFEYIDELVFSRFEVVLRFRSGHMFCKS
jgi:hypothetical protein